MDNTEHYIKLATSVLMGIEPYLPEISTHLRALENAPAHKRERIVRAIGTLWPETQVSSVEPTSEEYPNVRGKIAAKLTLGIDVGEELTRAERHEWLTRGALLDPVSWLVHDLPKISDVRSVAVARWLLHVVSSEASKAALYRENRWGSLASHASDLTDEDVAPHDDGSTPGVNAVAARREERMIADEFGEEMLNTLPEWLSSMGGRIRPLMTGRSLAVEDREMSHCVGGYVSRVKNGDSVICAVSAFGHRATVEYNRDGKIMQIRGARNSQASNIARRVAELAVKSNTRRDDTRRS